MLILKKERMQAWIYLHALFLMNRRKYRTSWVLARHLYWENKMYKRKRSIDVGIVYQHLLDLSGTACVVIDWFSALYSKVRTAWLRRVLSSSIQFPRDIINNKLISLYRTLLYVTVPLQFFPLQFLAFFLRTRALLEMEKKHGPWLIVRPSNCNRPCEWTSYAVLYKPGRPGLFHAVLWALSIASLILFRFHNWTMFSLCYRLSPCLCLVER